MKIRADKVGLRKNEDTKQKNCSIVMLNQLIKMCKHERKLTDKNV